MRTRNSILLTAALAVLLLAGGCKKYGPWHPAPGTAVRLAVTAQAPLTKTAYGALSDDGKHQRIDWKAGDQITIWMSNDEVDFDFGDYSITNVTSPSSEISRADLTPVGSAFEWGEGAHSFVGFYPSPSVSSLSEDDRWFNEINDQKIIFSWPSVQTPAPKGASGADALTLLPDMKYAYMYAFTDVEAPQSQITLSFMPLFTAFEIQISAGDNDEINLTDFRLVSGVEGEILACQKRDFLKLDLQPQGTVDDGMEGKSNEISIHWEDKITLTRDGDPLTFTVFAFAPLSVEPGFASLNQLTIEFTGDEIGTRTLDLKDSGNWITFETGLKHRISGLFFPRLDEGAASGQGINWGGMSGEDLGWNGAEGEDINWR